MGSGGCGRTGRGFGIITFTSEKVVLSGCQVGDRGGAPTENGDAGGGGAQGDVGREEWFRGFFNCVGDCRAEEMEGIAHCQ
jgi:hypothetical protein